MDRYIGQTVVCVGNIHQTIVDCFVLEACREYRDNLRDNMSDNSDHISTEGGHAEHVLVTRISNKMDTSSTDKQIFECSICPRSVEFRSAIYIGSASG